MDVNLERLAQKAVTLLQETPPDRRLIICIAGPPGSGKSTLAYPLTDRINALLGHAPREPANSVGPLSAGLVLPGETSDGRAADDSLAPAAAVPLDGWHLTRAQLDALPDPATAHFRRGAAFTFDAEGYLAFVRSLNPVADGNIQFNTFDHAVKDPAPSEIPIRRGHRIVLIEGLYTLLDRPVWREAAALCDMRVWVDVDREAARRRLVARNWAAGLAESREAVARRVDESDMLNGEEVREHRVKPTDEVLSREEPALAGRR